ncbi:MAG: hypothetical protein F6J87_10705 [Spirulina sp. SIO3F2]|nr:hypothetical protein [Spirulina sp. SIO3F2]
MSRRIVWTAYESGGTEASIDGYFDRLLKYIPADVVGLWLTGSGLIQSQNDTVPRLGLLWLLFVAGLVFSFFWIRKQTAEAGKPTAWRQVVLSCVSFAIWVFAIGGPFAELSWYQPIYGSLVLLFYTSAIPLLPAPK